MADFEIVPGLRFISRAAWGADANLGRLGRKVARDNRTHVFIHHTTMIDSDDSPNIWETDTEVFAMMRRLQVVRRADLGADVPYNFVVFLMQNGKVIICEGRGEDRSGAHTKGHNTKAIGVCFAGDFENKDVGSNEISNAIHLVSQFLGWLKYSASHPSYGNFSPMKKLGELRPKNRAVFVHRDVKNTACPGVKIEKRADQFRFIKP